MFAVEMHINKSDYLKMNRHYLKKYLGMREYILLGILSILGIALYILTGQVLILILTVATFVILIVFLLVYILSSNKLYKSEFETRKVERIDLRFKKDKFELDVYEKIIDEKYTEEFIYENIEKVAILQDRIYIYLGAASMYYLKAEAFTEGSFIEFSDFIRQKLPSHKFRMKKTRLADKYTS